MHFKQTTILALASSAYAANQVIRVGGNKQLTFTPQTVNAAVGDTVTFQFIDQNHTVTSGSSANAACSPDGTFNSGFVPVPSAGAATAATAATGGRRNRNRARSNIIMRGLNNIFAPRDDFAESMAIEARGWEVLEVRQTGGTPSFTVKVASTNPQPFYCAQAQHCQVGMVGVINPANTGANSLNAVVNAAAKAGTNKLPNTAAGTGGTLNAAAKAVSGKQAPASSAAAAGTAATATAKAGKGAAGAATGATGAAKGAAGAGNGATSAANGAAGAATGATSAANGAAGAAKGATGAAKGAASAANGAVTAATSAAAATKGGAAGKAAAAAQAAANALKGKAGN